MGDRAVGLGITCGRSRTRRVGPAAEVVGAGEQHPAQVGREGEDGLDPDETVRMQDDVQADTRVDLPGAVAGGDAGSRSRL